ncbi:GCD2 Translation initiation factor eIF-2B subunit delta [Candida maltosa Xu316]
MSETEKKPVSAETPATENGEKKLTNKELKELKKKEKAAKRAAQKEANGITPEQQKKLAEQKRKQQQQAQQQAAAAASASASAVKKQLNQAIIKEERRVPALFGHLETREQRNAASPTISNIVHPDILSLTLKYSNFKVVGSNSRLKNMLLAFKQVIQDYSTPENTTLTRHLTAHLSHQIEYLKTGRPLSVSMGNAIRWLKQEISVISIDTSEQQAKEILCKKIELSDRLIVESASRHIADGSTILTYGHSQVLEELFKYCVVEQNKKFNLIVVDSRPLFEGKKLVKNLISTHLDEDNEVDDLASVNSKTFIKTSIAKDNISIQYALINSVSSTLLDDVDCAFLGAHAMLSNGRLYSRVGTALIAMMCHTRNIPVLTCCESVKFSDKVQLDSVTTNELADSEDLIGNINTMKPVSKKSFALEQFLKQNVQPQQSDKKPVKGGKNDESNDCTDDNENDPLKDWKDIHNLSIINIMYDLTPPEYINKVITELGALPPSSVPVILREYKNT